MELQIRQSSKVSVQLIQDVSCLPMIASAYWRTRLTYGVIPRAIGRKFDRRNLLQPEGHKGQNNNVTDSVIPSIIVALAIAIMVFNRSGVSQGLIIVEFICRVNIYQRVGDAFVNAKDSTSIPFTLLFSSFSPKGPVRLNWISLLRIGNI